MNGRILLAQAKNFFVDIWEKLVIFFNSYQWQEILFNIKLIFILISIFLFILIVVLLIKINIVYPFKKKLHYSSLKEPVLNRKKTKKKWMKIEKSLESDSNAAYKLAVLEAEKIFDRILKELGYGIEKRLANINEIKEANKVKNNIIEDKKLILSKEKAKKAVEEYKRGLKELGAL